jgi:hypothetical protein
MVYDKNHHGLNLAELEHTTPVRPQYPAGTNALMNRMPNLGDSPGIGGATRLTPGPPVRIGSRADYDVAGNRYRFAHLSRDKYNSQPVLFERRSTRRESACAR